MAAGVVDEKTPAWFLVRLTYPANRASVAVPHLHFSPPPPTRERTTPLDLKDIKIIIDLMKKNDLSVFQLEREGFKLKIGRGPAPGAYTVAASPAPAPGPFAPGLAPAAMAGHSPETAAAAAAPAEKLTDIPSPMVGTFYQAMSPESPAYVKVGQTVTADTVVCIIEAMKVMNEIKAETSGVVVEIAVENGKPVQFGQPLFRLRPA